MIRPLIAFACLLVPSIFVASADAQLVRIGPWGGVRIRVPFVSVDVSPWGDTHVRAPFTDVHAPGDRYYHPYDYDDHDYHGHYDRGYRGYYYPHVFSDDFGLPQHRHEYYEDRWDRGASLGASPYHPHDGPVFVPPSAAAPEEYGVDRDAYRVPRSEPLRDSTRSRVSPAEVSGTLRDAAARLRNSLSRRGEQGEIWLDYLQPGRIVEVLEGGQPLESLQPLLANYEGVTNSQVSWVRRVDGFTETHRLLESLLAGGAQEASAAPREEERRREAPETLELPPPQPAPEGVRRDDAAQNDEPQSASANSPERFSL